MQLWPLLWGAAGADSQMLGTCPKADQIKFASLGLFITTMTLLTFISLTLAQALIFNTPEDSSLHKFFNFFTFIPVSLLWGFITFNLFRLIVASTGFGDGTSAITKKEIKDNIFKFIVALLLGACISAPITTLLLHNEIINETSFNEQARIEDKLKIIDFRYSQELAVLYKELAFYQSLTNNISPLEAPIKRERIAQKQQEILKLREKISQEKLKAELDLHNNNNLTLIQETEKSFENHKVLSLTVLIFFCLISVVPIILRMLWTKSSYEYLCEYHENFVLLKYGINPYVEIFNANEKSVIVKFTVPNLILNHTIKNLQQVKHKNNNDLTKVYKQKLKQLKQETLLQDK